MVRIVAALSGRAGRRFGSSPQARLSRTYLYSTCRCVSPLSLVFLSLSLSIYIYIYIYTYIDNDNHSNEIL